jgi:hypothetical protein
MGGRERIRESGKKGKNRRVWEEGKNMREERRKGRIGERGGGRKEY